jgi:hypothetical protein
MEGFNVSEDTINNDILSQISEFEDLFNVILMVAVVNKDLISKTWKIARYIFTSLINDFNKQKDENPKINPNVLWERLVIRKADFIVRLANRRLKKVFPNDYEVYKIRLKEGWVSDLDFLISKNNIPVEHYNTKLLQDSFCINVISKTNTMETK